MLFFFFKQKTAYEMRISDWSSDVCSSDLATRIEADLAGLDSGAVLTPAAARDLDLELVMPSSGERFRATVRVDDVVISEDLEFEGDTLRLRPAELVESELVESALSEGEHAIEVAVPRRSEEHTSELQSLMRNS